MLVASTFAFHLTYACPLSCAHCCFESSPAAKDGLDPDFVLASIEDLPTDLEWVAFTGGEPFLLGQHLVKFVQAAKRRGFNTRIVTSAYFGATLESAEKQLAPLIRAGLDELMISWDDYHEKFVPFARIRNVVEVAVSWGLTTFINSVQSAKTTWTADRIAQELGDELAAQLTSITPSDLFLTGRAETELAGEGFTPNGYLGPCPYVLNGPTMNARGRLLACCGAIPDAERLTVSSKITSSRDLAPAIAKSASNPLFQWLFLRGPYMLIEEICKRNGLDPPDKKAIGGNCEACKMLFEDSRFESRIDSVLEEKIIEIRSELLLLESLGWLSTDRIYDLWLDRSVNRAVS